MATQNYVQTNGAQHGGCRQVAWALMANGDVGAWIGAPDFSGKTFQVSGTFGAGGNVILEGSNDVVPTNTAPLTDSQGNALNTVTAATFKTTRDMPLWVRPRVSAGDGTTSILVTLCSHRLDIAMVG